MPKFLAPMLPRLAALVASVAVCGCPANLADNVEAQGPIGGPFAVSRFFTPSGYMGDGEQAGFILADVNDQCLPRPEGARGNCYRFRYNEGPVRWAGVSWVYPANNWGSRSGRSIASGVKFTKVRFHAALRYRVALPPGANIGGACSTASDCRPGLTCTDSRCAPSGAVPTNGNCLTHAECSAGNACIAQHCVAVGTGPEGTDCTGGRDELCAFGLRCGERGGGLQCILDITAGDVGERCSTRNDCLGGLNCAGGVCTPATRRTVQVQAGGIVPSNPELTHQDSFAASAYPTPLMTNDLQPFEIDISDEFTELLGAFMWAVPFPDGDDVATNGPAAYEADVTQPVTLYFDDIFYE